MVSLQHTTLQKDLIMTVSQKNAVFTAISAVIGDINPSQAVSLSASDRTAVISAVVEGFKHGEVALTEAAHGKYIANASDDKALIKYTGSLLTNWLRKDPRLTGGEPHVIKNPGSRNTVVSNMRKLQQRFDEGTNEFMQIQAKIDEELAKVKVKKSTAKPVDYSMIPSDLLDALNLND